MASVHDVAALLTELQREQTARRQGLAGMASSKLHKLAYLCQAYTLAWSGEPLFAEDVLAAESGPVVAELFQHHPGYDMPDPWPEGASSNLTISQRAFVEAVWSPFSDDTGMHLGDRTRTHVPWIRARALCTDEIPRPAIAHDDMLCFYRAFNDAPDTRREYAERFMDQYRSTTELTFPDPARK